MPLPKWSTFPGGVIHDSRHPDLSFVSIQTRHLNPEVWKSDLVDYFQWLLKEDIVQLKESVKAEEKARAAELEQRLANLQTPGYQKWYGLQLQKHCQFRNLKTQRETALTSFQELARCLKTWQNFDYNIWRAWLDTTEKPRVAVEAKFLEQVRSGNLVLGWSDQVPW